VTIDEQQLQGLGDVRFPPVVRPAAEVRARARQLRRRRDAVRAGTVAAAVAGVVATVALGSAPWLSAREPPAGTTVPFTPECPQPGGPALALSEVPGLLLLPSGIPVESVSAAQTARECQVENPEMVFRDGYRVLDGRWLFLRPEVVPAFRGTGDLPGRHERLTVDGVRVDLWRTGGPVPRYRAYWKVPGGGTVGAHAENTDADLRRLKNVVRQTKGWWPGPGLPPGVTPNPPNPPTPGVTDEKGEPLPLRYVRATLRPAGWPPVELRIHSRWVGYAAPVGAHRVKGLEGDGPPAWWWEEDGVGHLEWNAHRGPAGLSSFCTLQGTGLTLVRAVRLAQSLEQVSPDDPRLRSAGVGRSGETAVPTGN